MLKQGADQSFAVEGEVEVDGHRHEQKMGVEIMMIENKGNDGGMQRKGAARKKRTTFTVWSQFMTQASWKRLQELSATSIMAKTAHNKVRLLIPYCIMVKSQGACGPSTSAQPVKVQKRLSTRHRGRQCVSTDRI